MDIVILIGTDEYEYNYVGYTVALDGQWVDNGSYRTSGAETRTTSAWEEAARRHISISGRRIDWDGATVTGQGVDCPGPGGTEWPGVRIVTTARRVGRGG